MMEEKKPASKIRPGDKVIRKQRKHGKRLRIAPTVPEAIRFFRFIFTQTPFLSMMTLLAILWPIFALFLYFAEHNVNPDLNNYGNAIWWGLVAMTSMGTTSPPLTGIGQLVGGVWAVIGCIIFYGMIIASVTAYFAKRKEGAVKQIVSTLEYNLEHMDKLSIEELKLLKETADGVIDAQIEMSKYQGRGGLDK